MPGIGFGCGSTWRVTKADKGSEEDFILPELVDSIENAIEAGFEHLDSAEIYKTRKELLLGIKNSSFNRSKFFITDKYFCGIPRLEPFTDSPYESIKLSLKDLETDYLDLYLLHSSALYPGSRPKLTLEEAWQHVERAYDEGLVKAIGVSNFSVEDIEQILKVAKTKPMNLQIEYHAMSQNKTPGIYEFCKKNGIQISAYAPLAPITLAKEPNTLKEKVLELAKKYGKTDAQILLRWVTQTGVIPVTTSGKKERLHQSIDIYSFKLDDDDVAEISKLGEQNRTTYYNW